MGYRQLNDGIIQTMKDLRANDWSFEGIARIYSAYGVTASTVEFLVRDGAVAALVDRAVDLVMGELAAQQASDAIEREIAPYDLLAEPKAYVFLQPGWGERLKELASRNDQIVGYDAVPPGQPQEPPWVPMRDIIPRTQP